MSTDSIMDGLSRVLGPRAAFALKEWARAQSRSVRLASPEWKSQGYTGAVRAAINVSTSGEPDMKMIVKVCPPGPYSREQAYHQAKANSSEIFFADHIVELFGTHPIAGGGLLMFQEIASSTLDVIPLSEVPDEHLAQSCEVVIRAILAKWNPSRIRSCETTVSAFLNGELRGALEAGGSVHALATHVQLLQPAARWILDASRAGSPLPNPALMASDAALGAEISFDVIRGPAHGDLQLENVLVPRGYGLEPQRFHLVDLSAFEADAPITRDPVTLMLSTIAPRVSQLLTDEQEALIDLVLEPWPPAPQRLSALMAHTLGVIYRTGNEETKIMRLGDWRSQYLLSVQASAMLFTSFESLGDAGRWWYLRLAARAGAAFLRRHNHYHPEQPVVRRRPLTMPASRAAATLWANVVVRPGDPADPPRSVNTDDAPWRDDENPWHPPLLHHTERRALIDLLEQTLPEQLSVAYGMAVDLPSAPSPSWGDPASVVQRLEVVSTGTVPALLVFVDRLAHISSGQSGLALHRWVSKVARAKEIPDDVLRLLCVDSENVTAKQPATPHSPMASKQTADPPTAAAARSMLSLQGGHVRSDAAPSPSAEGVKNTPQRHQILGNLPPKNPSFIGREQLLQQIAQTLTEVPTSQATAAVQVSVVPLAFHGLGGVGKTQLAIEFVHRNLHQYDLVWWISAEEPALVRSSLVDLARKLDLSTGQEVRPAIMLVLDALATSNYKWLLVYDNVDRPEDVNGLVPSAGGQVIITSRNNAAWATRCGAIEVDVFERDESVQLLQRHGHNISTQDAEHLAEKLGDLPLALAQAAIWHASTGMPIGQYLELLDKNLKELLEEGRPPNYPHTVYGILKVAVDRLRVDNPAAAELWELFAFLGAEPISVDLLRRGRGAALSENLATALLRPIELNRVIRVLRRFGLARVDTKEGQRIQVHRLVQRVLREELQNERLTQARANAQRLLATANPGYPDEPNTWSVHAEIGPHIQAAELLSAPEEAQRYVVLDQIRFLFRMGDYEASKALGEATLEAWSGSADEALGPDQELALIAGRHLANALRLMGEMKRASNLNTAIFEKLRISSHFGEDHEHTLYTANCLGVDLRLEGDFQKALEVEQDNVERHRRVLGEDDELTWRAEDNLAVSLRHLGSFKAAYDIDDRLTERWHMRYNDNDPRTLLSVANLSRDLYGLGRYRVALERQRKALVPYRDHLGPLHGDVLTASRTITISLRKAGYYADARDNGRDNYHDHHAKFGPRHEHTLSSAGSYANALRCSGEYSKARAMQRDTVDTYRELFGERHPLTLAATVNLAIALRQAGDHDEAASLDEQSHEALAELLGASHPYTLAAANGRAHWLAQSRQTAAAAAEWSAQTLAYAQETHGVDHPVTLAYAVNAAFDQFANDEAAGRVLLEQSIEKMRETIGSDHPDTLDAARGVRQECDLEPPPA